MTIKTLALALMAAVLLSAPAHAYLDPGTGSYMLQIAIATVLGGVFAFKQQWQRLISRFKKTPSPSATKDS